MRAARIERIEKAIAACEELEIAWTNQMIFHHVGGNYSALAQYLKARRARGELTVAVLEMPGPRGELPEPSVEEPAADDAGPREVPAVPPAMVIPRPPPLAVGGRTPLGMHNRCMETPAAVAVHADPVAEA